MECIYCKSILSSKSNLISHQLKAKYCLEKQKELSIDTSTNKYTEKFTCDFCTKEFKYKHHKVNHELRCKNKCSKCNIIISNLEYTIQEYETKVQEYEKKIIELKTEYEIKINNLNSELTSEKNKSKIYNDLYNTDHTFILNQNDKLSNKPTINTNNNQTNIVSNKTKVMNLTRLDLTLKHFKKIMDPNDYTFAHYLSGIHGQAIWALKYTVDEEGNIMYANTNRKDRNFAHINMEGTYSTDKNASVYKDIIKHVLSDYIKHYRTTMVSYLNKIENKLFEERLYKIMRENSSQEGIENVLDSFVHVDTAGFPKLNIEKLEAEELHIRERGKKLQNEILECIEKCKIENENLKDEEEEIFKAMEKKGREDLKRSKEEYEMDD